MTPNETHERRLSDLRRFTSLLQSQTPFAAVKFNDGEWHAMNGKHGRNCDNHEYSEPLQQAMQESYEFLKPRASISDWVINYRYPEHVKLASRLGYPADYFVHFAMLHDLPFSGQCDSRTQELKDLYRAIRGDTRQKVFVGPKRLHPESFLQLEQRISTPMVNAFKSIGDLTKQVQEAAKQTNPVFLLSCGFTSCVLSQRILQENPNATIIDLGSALDPLLFGKTRKSQLTTSELRDFYSDFNCEWPQMPHYCDEIQGWFNYADLYQQMVRRFPAGHFVEVGSWLGKSAAFMAVEIQRSGKRILFDCVDTFKGSPGEKVHANANRINVKGQCINNLRPFWSTKNNLFPTTRKGNMLKIVIGSSPGIAAKYADKSLDFVFIDASHDEKSVRCDITGWLPKIKSGGVLAGHDYSSKSFPGVRRAVDSMLPQRKLVSKNCWMVEL